MKKLAKKEFVYDVVFVGDGMRETRYVYAKTQRGADNIFCSIYGERGEGWVPATPENIRNVEKVRKMLATVRKLGKT